MSLIHQSFVHHPQFLVASLRISSQMHCQSVFICSGNISFLYPFVFPIVFPYRCHFILDLIYLFIGLMYHLTLFIYLLLDLICFYLFDIPPNSNNSIYHFIDLMYLFIDLIYFVMSSYATICLKYNLMTFYTILLFFPTSVTILLTSFLIF